MVNRRLLNLTVFSDIDNAILAASDVIFISDYLFLHKNVSINKCLNKRCFKLWKLNEPAKLNEDL